MCFNVYFLCGNCMIKSNKNISVLTPENVLSDWSWASVKAVYNFDSLIAVFADHKYYLVYCREVYWVKSDPEWKQPTCFNTYIRFNCNYTNKQVMFLVLQNIVWSCAQILLTSVESTHHVRLTPYVHLTLKSNLPLSLKSLVMSYQPLKSNRSMVNKTECNTLIIETNR